MERNSRKLHQFGLYQRRAELQVLVVEMYEKGAEIAKKK